MIAFRSGNLGTLRVPNWHTLLRTSGLLATSSLYLLFTYYPSFPSFPNKALNINALRVLLPRTAPKFPTLSARCT